MKGIRLSIDPKKYIVFRRAQFDEWMAEVLEDYEGESTLYKMELPDAVVIRQQDVFSPPALDAYANSIEVALSLAKPDEITARLRAIADYFHQKASEAWHMHRKLPD